MYLMTVEEARGLIAADQNGFSDPYCKFQFKKTKYRTRTERKTLFPKWNKQFEILKVKDEDLDTEIRIEVYDEDLVGKNDFLGQHIFKLSTLRLGATSGWFDLQNKANKTDELRGQIRVKMIYEDLNTNQMSQSNAAFRFLEIATFIVDEIAGRGDYLNNLILMCVGKALDDEEEKEYKSKNNYLDVFIGTWNVGNAPPPPDLSPWIPKDEKYSLYVIGTQECKYKFREPYDSCADDWKGTLVTHFGPSYCVLKQRSLGQMRIIVFCKRADQTKFMNFETATEATGIGHVMSNKGGVAISLTYMDTDICFINAHLAAHQHKTARRNSDVQEIINGISRTLGKFKADIMCQFDHVIFMGDLNYRLDYGDQGEEKKPTKEQFDNMVKKIENEKYDVLFSCDQLSTEMRKGRVLCGFKEGSYHFPPTFKVLRQKELAYTEERSPSWCDRILWHSLTKEYVQQLSLKPAMDIATSDHKPVSAVLRLPTYNLPGLTRSTVASVKIGLDQKSLNPVYSNIPDINSTIKNPDRLMYTNIIVKISEKDVMSSKTIGGVYIGSAVIQGRVTIVVEEEDVDHAPSISLMMFPPLHSSHYFLFRVIGHLRAFATVYPL
eukprot:jgi/Bigna1/130552/aug1.11_g5260